MSGKTSTLVSPLTINSIYIMAPYCFKFSEVQVLAETVALDNRHLHVHPLKTVLEKLNALYEVCLRIEDDEDVIDYLTIALWDLIHKVQEKVPQSQTSYSILCLPSMQSSAISFRSIIARMYDILEECRYINEVNDITDAILTTIHQAKTYQPRSTMFLLDRKQG